MQQIYLLDSTRKQDLLAALTTLPIDFRLKAHMRKSLVVANKTACIQDYYYNYHQIQWLCQ